MLDPEDLAGFLKLGRHGFDFDRHGNVVLTLRRPEGPGRVLYCWRVDGSELVLEEVGSKETRRRPIGWAADEVLSLDGVRYVRKDEGELVDPESGVFCMALAGLRHGLASAGPAAAKDTESFSPMLLLDDALELSSFRIFPREGQSAEASAKKRATASSAFRCAFVYDGTSGGQRAVISVASQRGLKQGRLLALRYRLERGEVVPQGPVDSQPAGAWW